MTEELFELPNGAVLETHFRDWSSRAATTADIIDELRAAQAEQRMAVVDALEETKIADSHITKLEAYVTKLTGRAEAAERRAEEAERKLSMVTDWCNTYGADLVPTGSDSYGEGKRDAKATVKRLIHGVTSPTVAASETEVK